MNGQDRQAIEGLFEKLADVERRGQPLDPEAEDFIAERIARQPGAPYYMAQTIVMQEQALAEAQTRIEGMEREAASQGSSGRGLFSGLFGGGGRPSRASHEMPRVPRRRAQESYPPQGAYPPMSGGYAPRGGGGFLAGAAQTAMGVAGGVLLGNAIGGMFADEAAAAEGFMGESSEEPMEEPAVEDAGFEDGGDMEF